MANPLLAAVKVYWAIRTENRAERIDRAAKRLAVIAKEQKAKTQGRRKRSAPSDDRPFVSHDKPRRKSRKVNRNHSRPYDWAESGAVNCPMWCDEQTREFVFGVRWKTVKDGKSYYRRTVSVEMFEDLIRALTDLAARYAAEERVPLVIRRRMKEYYLFLKTVPDCVREELAKATMERTLNGGATKSPDKKQ